MLTPKKRWMILTLRIEVSMTWINWSVTGNQEVESAARAEFLSRVVPPRTSAEDASWFMTADARFRTAR